MVTLTTGNVKVAETNTCKTVFFLQLATPRLCLKVTDEKQHSSPNSLPLAYAYLL
ncbi:hypothetical protein C0J52_20786 [Blattella germanica]|nr:hypothetical protein C0J52_20786 [Blattella germanica]